MIKFGIFSKAANTRVVKSKEARKPKKRNNDNDDDIIPRQKSSICKCQISFVLRKQPILKFEFFELQLIPIPHPLIHK